MDTCFFFDSDHTFYMGFHNYEKEMITGLLAIFGVVIGSLITLLGGFIIKKRETKLKIIEKFMDRKFVAFDKLVIFLIEMRTAYLDGNKLYYAAFSSKENLEQFKAKLFEILSYSISYSSAIMKELTFLQSYLLTVSSKTKSVRNDQLKMVGGFLYADFFAMAEQLDKMLKDFSITEIAGLNWEPSKESFDYTEQEKKKKLQTMKLNDLDNYIKKII